MLINNKIVLFERKKIANWIRLLFTENEFAYLTNILHLLQVIFVASTKKNKYLLHLQIICNPIFANGICQIELAFIANLFSSNIEVFRNLTP